MWAISASAQRAQWRRFRTLPKSLTRYPSIWLSLYLTVPLVRAASHGRSPVRRVSRTSRYAVEKNSWSPRHTSSYVVRFLRAQLSDDPRELIASFDALQINEPTPPQRASLDVLAGLRQMLQLRSMAAESVTTVSPFLDSFTTRYKKGKYRPSSRLTRLLIQVRRQLSDVLSKDAEVDITASSQELVKALRFIDWLFATGELPKWLRLGDFNTVIETMRAADSGLAAGEDAAQRGLALLADRATAYQLEPNAMINDVQTVNYNAMAVSTFITSLGRLQSAYSAWYRAYMSVDTALQLMAPNAEQSLLSPVTEARPVNEGFQLFATISCANAVAPHVRVIVASKLLAMQKVAQSPQMMKELALGMISTTHISLATSSQIPPSTMPALMTSIALLIPRSTGTAYSLRERKAMCGRQLARVIKFMQSVSPAAEQENNRMAMTNSALFIAIVTGNSALLKAILEAIRTGWMTMSRLCWRTIASNDVKPQDTESIRHWWEDWMQTGTIPQLATISLKEVADLYAIRRSSDMADAGITQAHGPANDLERLLQLPKTPKDRKKQQSISSLPEEWPEDWTLVDEVVEALDRLGSIAALGWTANLKQNRPERLALFEDVATRRHAWQKQLWLDLRHRGQTMPADELDAIDMDDAPETVTPPSHPTENSNQSSYSITSSEKPLALRHGFKLGELRFLSWCAINDLLFQAQVFDDGGSSRAAIAETAAKINMPTWAEKVPPFDYMQSSQRVLEELAADRVYPQTEAEWRTSLLQMRGLSETETGLSESPDGRSEHEPNEQASSQEH